MNTGGRFAFDFGSVKLTMAHHGSMLPDGSYGGLATGVLLKTVDGNIYFAGDTALFSDMTLIGDEGLKVAVLPIGDNFTMGPEDSIKALKFLRPETVIPCHYNTFSAIEQDVDRWAADVSATSVKPMILAPGQSMTL
jgi:L-ascorbate metabolism protein UlaG (beta-lactamase superfamily)